MGRFCLLVIMVSCVFLRSSTGLREIFANIQRDVCCFWLHTSGRGYEEMFRAAGRNDWRTLQTLEWFEECEATSARDEFLRTPLMYAAMQGNTETVSYLCSRPCCVDTQDELGRTALYYAAQKGHLATVCILLAQGANPQNSGMSQSNVQMALHEILKNGIVASKSGESMR